MNQRTRISLENAVFFMALMATATAFGAALAHSLEFANKMGLGEDAYFTVQQIYAGWNRLAFVLLAELLGIVAVIAMNWRRTGTVRAGFVALAALVLAQATFWTWTYPANAVTDNWTTRPENWEVLRANWEYSHLAGFLFQTVALGALIVAALARRRPATAHP